MNELFVRNGNHEWVNHLRDIEYSINTNQLSNEKFAPYQLWRPGYFSVSDGEYSKPRLTDISTKNQIIRHRQETLIERAHKQVERNDNQLQINDLVRIANEVLYPEFRARAKNSMEKKLSSIIWSPDLYRVCKIYPSQKVPLALRTLGNKDYDLGQIFYGLRTYPEGDYIRKKFARSELMDCGNIHNKPVPVKSYEMNLKKASQLNLFIPLDK
jgi:hypothetical protein